MINCYYCQFVALASDIKNTASRTPLCTSEAQHSSDPVRAANAFLPRTIFFRYLSGSKIVSPYCEHLQTGKKNAGKNSTVVCLKTQYLQI